MSTVLYTVVYNTVVVCILGCNPRSAATIYFHNSYNIFVLTAADINGTEFAEF